MKTQLQMCRVCTDDEGGEELVPIYEKSNKVAMDIFLISGVKILEFNKIPALICVSCVEALSTAMSFRKKCRETDDFFRRSHFEAEKIIWDNAQDVSESAFGSQPNDSFRVKQESSLDRHKIKDEPFDDFHVDFFENIDTVLEENLDESEESNALAGILKKEKRDYSYSNSSESESEYKARKRQRFKNAMKRSAAEFRDFDLW